MSCEILGSARVSAVTTHRAVGTHQNNLLELFGGDETVLIGIEVLERLP